MAKNVSSELIRRQGLQTTLSSKNMFEHDMGSFCSSKDPSVHFPLDAQDLLNRQAQEVRHKDTIPKELLDYDALNTLKTLFSMFAAERLVSLE
jgi:hypothetical protein